MMNESPSSAGLQNLNPSAAPAMQQVPSPPPVVTVVSPSDRPAYRREMRCDTQDFILANTLVVMRWIAALLVFAAIIVSWVYSNNYASVILGIFNLFAFFILIAADTPVLRSVTFVRRTTYGLCTGNFLRMSLFLGFMCLATPRQFGLLTQASGAAYTVAASVIMGFVSLVTFVAWIGYFRLHGDPEVHWVDAEAAAVSAGATANVGGQVPGTGIPATYNTGAYTTSYASYGTSPTVPGGPAATFAPVSSGGTPAPQFREVVMPEAVPGPTTTYGTAAGGIKV